LIRSKGSNYELGLSSLENGCLSLAEGKFQPALAELQVALDQFQRGSLAAETGWTQVWLAAVLAGSGETAAAGEHLRAVLDVLSREAEDTPLVHMLRHAAPWLAGLHSDPEMEPLFSRVTRAGGRLPLLRKRLRRMLKAAPMKSSRLAIQVLGKPQVRVNGKMVTLSHWQTLSVRDLFFYFLTVSHQVTKDEIGAVLWPEIDPDRLKLRFKNNLYRLRHALGQDVILFENNLYFFNRATDYEYDVEEFDAHLAQARSVERVEDRIVHLRLATRLWHGPYLLGVDAIWAEPERHRLEQACLDALRQLVGLQRQTGDHAGALQSCQCALEVNACLEDFHRLAMQLHAERGDQLAVIWQYQACRDALQIGLDIPPSEETQVLYQHLIA
jgi:two-component SAPR family response regulator